MIAFIVAGILLAAGAFFVGYALGADNVDGRGK